MPTNPTCSILGCCCARADSGHAIAPPSSVMKWRRLVSSMGSSPEPAVPAYGRVRVHRKRPAVLGIDLNRSESSRWARRLRAHRRSPNGTLWNVRPGIAASIRFDARELHHLAPFLGLFDEELAEVAG